MSPVPPAPAFMMFTILSQPPEAVVQQLAVPRRGLIGPPESSEELRQDRFLRVRHIFLSSQPA
jgi:hypothetical protein